MDQGSTTGVNGLTRFRTVTEKLRFPEGPVAMPDGSVLVVEIAGKALTRVQADGSHQVIAEFDTAFPATGQ
jgi:gluconolactonase